MTKSVLEIVMEREKLAYGRSIPLCRNDKNEFLLPRNTEHGVWYKCYDPTCTACFFKRVRDGKAHMVIRSGEEHTGVSCASDSKRKTIMDLGKTLQGGLASAIMHPPARREKEPETDSSAGSGDTGIKRPRAPNVMEDYTRSMSSLKDLEKYGFTKLPNCELDDGMMTVDLFVNRNNAHYIMEDNGKPELGPAKSRMSKRIVPVPADYRADALYLRENAGNLYVWTSTKRENGLYDVGSFRRRYYYAIRSVAGVRKLSPHCCRHTYVSHLEKRGVPMELISRLAGHSKIDTTNGYLHTEMSTLSNAVSLLNEHTGEVR